MKYKKTGVIVLCFLVIVGLAGCDGIFSRFIARVEIGNTFSDFAPGFSSALVEGGTSLSGRAKNSLASQVSMNFEIPDKEMLEAGAAGLSSAATNPPAATLEEEVYHSESDTFHMNIEDVSKDDFIAFLEAGNVDDVPADLQDEWLKLDYLRQQNISNVNIFHDDVDFGEEPDFDSDTVGAIRNIISVDNSSGSLAAELGMDINEISYAGSINVSFLKINDDWRISGLELYLEEE